MSKIETAPRIRPASRTRLDRRTTLALLALASLSFLPACDRKPSPGPGESAGKLKILTTFYPTTYLATRLAGDHAEVHCPLPPDADPITWRPDPEAIALYQAADLIILNGAGFEEWVERVSLPPSRVVETAAGFRDRWIQVEEAVTHSHGPEGEHTHTGLDGHTWLDPLLALEQSRAIFEALVRVRPAQEADFRESFTRLEADLRALDEALTELSKDLGKTPILASHPAYNYPGRRYGWNLRNLDLDPETIPSHEVIHDIEHALEDFPARILLWESAPSAEVSEVLEKKLGLKGVIFSPYETKDGESDAAAPEYLTVQNQNVKRLAEALRSTRGT